MKYLLTLHFIFLALASLFSQSTDSLRNEKIVVYGDEFSFNVIKPRDWIGNILMATQLQAKIVFYQSIEELENGGPLIKITIAKKQDKNTIDDLNRDVNKYKEEYSNLKLMDYSVEHNEYNCHSKIVAVENEFQGYITFINPGKEFANGISVAMKTSKRTAIKDEIKAYEMIIKSIKMIQE